MQYFYQNQPVIITFYSAQMWPCHSNVTVLNLTPAGNFCIVCNTFDTFWNYCSYGNWLFWVFYCIHSSVCTFWNFVFIFIEWKTVYEFVISLGSTLRGMKMAENEQSKPDTIGLEIKISSLEKLFQLKFMGRNGFYQKKCLSKRQQIKWVNQRFSLCSKCPCLSRYARNKL